MHRRLRLRPRARTVIWGARRGDRVVGTAEDLELERRRRAIAALDRRLTLAAIRQMRALSRRGMASSDAMTRMAEAFERLNAAMPTVAELAELQRAERVAHRAKARR